MGGNIKYGGKGVGQVIHNYGGVLGLKRTSEKKTDNKAARKRIRNAIREWYAIDRMSREKDASQRPEYLKDGKMRSDKSFGNKK